MERERRVASFIGIALSGVDVADVVEVEEVVDCLFCFLVAVC